MKCRVVWSNGKERTFDGRISFYDNNLIYFMKSDDSRVYIPLFDVEFIEEIKCGENV